MACPLSSVRRALCRQQWRTFSSTPALCKRSRIKERVIVPQPEPLDMTQDLGEFEKLFRNSHFVQMGMPYRKQVVARVIEVREDVGKAYVEYGVKFHIVVDLPKFSSRKMSKGDRVMIELKNTEMSQHLQGAPKHFSILEGKGTLMRTMRDQQPRGHQGQSSTSQQRTTEGEVVWDNQSSEAAREQQQSNLYSDSQQQQQQYDQDQQQQDQPLWSQQQDEQPLWSAQASWADPQATTEGHSGWGSFNADQSTQGQSNLFTDTLQQPLWSEPTQQANKPLWSQPEQPVWSAQSSWDTTNVAQTPQAPLWSQPQMQQQDQQPPWSAQQPSWNQPQQQQQSSQPQSPGTNDPPSWFNP